MGCLMTSLIRYAFSSTSVHAFDERAMPPVDAPFWARPFEPWPSSDHEIRDTAERRDEHLHASPPALPPPPPAERRDEHLHAAPPALPPPPPERRDEHLQAAPPALPPPQPPSPLLPPQPPQPPSLPSPSNGRIFPQQPLSNGRIFPQQPHRALDETASTWPSGGTCAWPASAHMQMLTPARDPPPL